MPKRIANIIILAEDQEHQNLVRRYLLRCGHDYRSFIFAPLPGGKGSGCQFVREQFPKRVGECRGRLGGGASCLLIVMTDADNLKTIEREQTLHGSLVEAGSSALNAGEPVIILIPQWQVETWIKCLLGQAVSESDPNTDRPPVDSAQISQAAGRLFEWARSNARVGATCVASLTAALPRWRRIG